MVWNKQHDGADLDEKLHRLRSDPFDQAPKMVEVPEDYLRALEAKAVRYSAMLYSSRELTDGVIDPAVLLMIAGNAQVYQHRVMGAIDALVRVQLLKKRTKRQGAGWEIPNFLKYNPSKDQVLRRRQSETRLAWLQNTAAGRKAREFIKERDGNRCRYCYIELRANDQKSPMRGTYDHARPKDAQYDRDPRWIVQACAFHNGQKLDRTPEEAGLTLLPPWSEADDAMRARAKDAQELALIVAATLSEQDPDPDTIIAAVREVLSTRSQPRAVPENPNSIQPRPGRDPVSASGRVGSGRDGTGGAGSGAVRDLESEIWSEASAPDLVPPPPTDADCTEGDHP